MGSISDPQRDTQPIRNDPSVTASVDSYALGYSLLAPSHQGSLCGPTVGSYNMVLVMAFKARANVSVVTLVGVLRPGPPAARNHTNAARNTSAHHTGGAVQMPHT
jgi:hypothetical protein